MALCLGHATIPKPWAGVPATVAGGLGALAALVLMAFVPRAIFGGSSRHLRRPSTCRFDPLLATSWYSTGVNNRLPAQGFEPVATGLGRLATTRAYLARAGGICALEPSRATY